MDAKFSIYLIIGLFVLGCNKPLQNEQEAILATVKNNNHLLVDEVVQEISQYQLSPDDSVKFINNYVTDWIKTQLLMYEIEKELSPQDLNVQKELEEYRQKLLIHRYKSKKTQNISDSLITKNESIDYYNNNKKSFVLRSPIVKVEYLIFPSGIEIPQNVYRSLSHNNKNQNTEEFIYSYARKFDNFNSQWIYFESILRNTNFNINDMAQFLRRENIVEFSHNNERHIIIIKKYMLSGEQSPFEFVENRIKNLLINNKKIDFLREIKDSLYNNTLKYNNFEAFNQ
ncbi:MAG: hypothetical protein PF436_05250 [Prolixibacteraceae bacterium]|jgi:hypothetical protein|nr:hypothetical protein [Prolixibacteraceae bacterium]